MKKVINNHIYDTKTAELIASEQYSEPQDARFYHIDLFRTPRGAWFEEIIGGALGVFGCREGNTRYGCDDMIPVSEAEAQDFVARNAEVETYLRFWEADEA